ncbi:gas-vesicle-associated protein GvpJ [Natrialba magadii ATCC 43099]|uniref:Gas vesicle protein GvpA n=1 Tax=Natrialba magadii (strain ATCC 43099 / DSM 3394 / CCM 3739 / CIP 104546 / IAM 13178 / JCM 8861 / NBRC 102185 / NCIMB 2190 / MS3) TaxID=547559 RepID=D3SXA9_NATMM|nr:gas vesicle protein [Natrialba magadii]ADD03929.1 gas-vesicle-associated protein GvpJ [Natrialba magadii ATCC 43099]ELY33592.1 gas vesicle protein GvpA [Natrialba magadii ATCC 43099]
MPDSFQPSRQQSDLADIVEMLLDKGIVINADIAVSIGDTQLLGIQLRAAIASFETAAKYGLEFPEGTDMQRVAEAAGDPELAEMERPKPAIDPTRGVNVTAADDGDEDSDDDDDSEAGGNGDDDDGHDDESDEETAQNATNNETAANTEGKE